MDSLCPADLLHYQGVFARRRLALIQGERRVALAVAEAAAALPYDKGKAVAALRKALDGEEAKATAQKKPTFGAALAARKGKARGDAA